MASSKGQLVFWDLDGHQPIMSNRNTVCLTLIVRNEAHVIRRALESAIPYVTHWAIIDTGSRDGTQQIIQQVMKDLPGSLVESPWLGFAASRNESLALARTLSDYALFIDADDVIEGLRSSPCSLDKPLYYWWVYDGSIRHKRVALVRRDIACKWVGETHEYLHFGEPNVAHDTFKHLSLRYKHEGARAQASDTYRADIDRMRQTLLNTPADVRLRFYLARTLHWCGEDRLADVQYLLVHRDSNGGREERWLAGLEHARLSESFGLPLSEVAAMFAKSIQERPDRAEPYVELARVLRELGQFADALSVAEHGASLRISDDGLFLDLASHGWKIWDEVCVNALNVMRLDQAERAGKKALMCDFLPRDERARIERNLAQIRT